MLPPLSILRVNLESGYMYMCFPICQTMQKRSIVAVTHNSCYGRVAGGKNNLAIVIGKYDFFFLVHKSTGCIDYMDINLFILSQVVPLEELG